MSEIKQAFTSRFEDGVLLEMDFSQLEVIGLAMLSLDPVLISDLESGMDMHRLRASELFNKEQEEVTDAERTITKKLSFQLQYGAGAASMSRKLGIKKAIAQAFIENYYGRYTRVKEWQEEVIEAIKRSRKPTNERLPSGLPRGRGEWESATGRTYVFMEQDSDYGDGEPSFNPPTMKNYPIQGFATGDVMAVYRAMVYREWLNSSFRRLVLPINTVHDSVMFDCVNYQVALEWKLELELLAKELVGRINESWDIPTPLPFKIETKIGPTWSEMRKV